VQALAGKRLPARFRYALGLLILLRLLVPVTPASGWSIFNLTRQVRPPPAAAPMVNLAAAPIVMVASQSILPSAIPSHPSRLSLSQWAALTWLCGGAGFLLAVLWRHRKFARWVAQLPTATDPRVVALVERCKEETGLRRAVRIVRVPPANSAAVFGFLRPRLLLPEGMMDTLDQHEARLVLLHEMFHILRRDVLVNWVSVLALVLHWFNPLAWVAMRRLRADQELACDADVLALIEQGERGAYGRTLLKHLQDFPAARMAAGLVPLIASRHNIKRRIIMITEFKQIGGLARGLFALLLVALGGLTFTRAVEDPQPASAPTNLSLAPVVPTPLPGASSARPPNADHGDPFFLSTQYKIIDAATRPTESATDYGSQYVKQSTLLEQLKSMQPNEPARFIQALSATTSDPILNSLLEQELAQQAKLAGLGRNPNRSQSDVQEAEAIMVEIKTKINERVNGIMDGMSLNVAALKAAANNELDHMHVSDTAASRRLDDLDHQRVMAQADLLEYSNILANLSAIPAAQLGRALTTAFAHQPDQELTELASRLEVAKANMTAVTQNYGQEMPVYKTANKQLEECKAAYQDKIEAELAGIRARVNEDKGFVQWLEREEKAIEDSLRKQQDDRRY